MKINNVSTTVVCNQVKNVAQNVKKNVLETYIEPARKGNMSRNLFVTAAFAFLLSGRLFNSRDNNEKRETLTRDIPTILLAVQGVPFFEKVVGKMLQKKSGFAILSDKKGNIASADQIHDWYRYDEKLASGFNGFMERLGSLNGNLKKITSSLNENIKGQLANFSENNDAFIKELSKEENKGLKQSIAEAFKGEGNGALKDASFKKSLPKLAGIGITLGLVGILIPQLNIAITESISKKKKPAAPSAPVNPVPAAPAAAQNAALAEETAPVSLPANMRTAQNSSSDSRKKVYSDFLG